MSTRLRGKQVPDAVAESGPVMRAIVREAYGPAQVLHLAQVAKPAPGAGEVLVRVRAAGISRSAAHIMTGKPYAMRLAGFGVRAPKVPGLGSELAGVVESVGTDVTEFSPGDSVFGLGRSSFAEYAVALPAKLALAPSTLTFEQAAAVGDSALTALQALRDRGRVRAGEHVLIIGASGGVGTFAVQIAKAFGAEVTGVASTAKLDLVRSAGADHVIDYTASDLGADGQRYDLVLDIGGNRRVRVLRRLLAPAGRLVFVGGEDGGQLLGLDRQLLAMLWSPFVRQQLGGPWIASENRADLEVLRAMIDDGAIVPSIDRVVPLAEIPSAMGDLIAGRVRGKVVAAI